MCIVLLKKFSINSICIVLEINNFCLFAQNYFYRNIILKNFHLKYRDNL